MTPRTSLTAAFACVALVIGTTACGGSSDEDTATTAGGASATAPADATTPPADATSPPVESSTDTAAPETAPVDASDDGGSCNVRVTGDVTAEWSSPGGYSAIGYGPWVDTSQGTIAGLAMDDSFFLLNCSGEGEDFVGFGTTVDGRIPMEPAVYTLPPADNAFGGSDTPSAVSVLVGLDGTDTNWGLSEPGTLEITKFDETGIAGTFRLPVTDILSKIPGGGASKGDAVIEGEFDYANPNP